MSNLLAFDSSKVKETTLESTWFRRFFMIKIKKATFYDINYINDKAENKSAIDKLNEYIVENQISKCDIINIEEKNDCDNYCLNLYYCESE